MRFNPATLARDFTARTGLKASAYPAFAAFMKMVEADSWTVLRQVAYLLATVAWESGRTFLPVREKRASAERQPELRRRQDAYWSGGYYGRGFVQLTWEPNYRRAGRELSGRTVQTAEGPLVIHAGTFLAYPDLLLEPEPSYLVTAQGMRGGWFTGKRLDHYIREGEAPDYFNARRIINRLDRTQEVAALAQGFELLLRAAVVPYPESGRATRAIGGG